MPSQAAPPDHDREPFSAADVRERLDDEVSHRWPSLSVVGSTGSTNADLAADARAGAPDGTVLVAHEQTAGRGRLDRQWASPSGASLSISVLLRPESPAGRLPWLPLVTGVAVVGALREVATVDVALKWPNDVLAPDGRKLAGLLAEVADPGAVVLGMGINVSLREDELPVPEATSLLLAGAGVEGLARPVLVATVLSHLARWERRWVAADGDPDRSGVRAAYREACATLGRSVRVLLPGRVVLEGRAVDIDVDGRLVIEKDASAEVVRISAGDVVHVR